MRCENCSREVRPVVALDIDGTLGDYHSHFLRFLSAYLGTIDRGGYAGDVRFSKWVCDTFNIDIRTYRDIKLAYRQGAQKRSMPVYPYASKLASVVRAAGAELWVTTSRPYMRLDNIDPDTREWLERNGIEYDHLLYGHDKYELLVERVDPERVVMVLDDLWYQCLKAADRFGYGVPILRGTRWNAAAPSPAITPRIEDLDDAADIAANRVRSWSQPLSI